LIGVNHLALKTALDLIISLVIVSIPYGIFVYLNGGRFESIFPHSNHYAYVLAILLFYVLERSRYSKLNFLYLVSILISIILTRSTGGFLTSVLLLLVHFLLSRKSNFLLKIFSIAFLGFFYVFLVYQFSDRFQSQVSDLSLISWDFIGERVSGGQIGGVSSGVWRITYWLMILEAFLNESTLTIIVGTGLDSLTHGNYIYEFVYTDPHNDYVKIIVESGVLGLGLFLLFIILLIGSVKHRLSIAILVSVPLLFGNILVNFPFNLTLILVLTYLYKNSCITNN
jgi:O-antigen ligase